MTALSGATNGTWQYSSDGTSWMDIGTVSAGKALLLSAGYRLRYVPKAGFLGTATLTAYAWDGSVGQVGTLFNISGETGGTGAFSRTPLTTTCLVNTAPTLAP